VTGEIIAEYIVPELIDGRSQPDVEHRLRAMLGIRVNHLHGISRGGDLAGQRSFSIASKDLCALPENLGSAEIQ